MQAPAGRSSRRWRYGRERNRIAAALALLLALTAACWHCAAVPSPLAGTTSAGDCHTPSPPPAAEHDVCDDCTPDQPALATAPVASADLLPPIGFGPVSSHPPALALVRVRSARAPPTASQRRATTPLARAERLLI